MRPVELQLAEVLGVGVPDPLHDVGEPGFGAVFFQAPHQVLVGEGVQAAEDLAHDADQRRLPVAARRRACGNGRGRAPCESRSAGSCTPGSTGVASSGAAQVGQALFVDRFGVAAPLFVGPMNQQQLLQQVGAQQRAPAGAHEGLGQRCPGPS